MPAALWHPHPKTLRRCPVFFSPLLVRLSSLTLCAAKTFTTATPLSAWFQPTGRDNPLHGSCLTVTQIDSPFRGWTVPFLFFFQCHIFQGFSIPNRFSASLSEEYAVIRFHRRGYFAPVSCSTIDYGSNCLLGLLNVACRDILCLSVEKISSPPCGHLVFFLPRANIPLRQPRCEFNEQAKLR